MSGSESVEGSSRRLASQARKANNQFGDPPHLRLGPGVLPGPHVADEFHPIANAGRGTCTDTGVSFPTKHVGWGGTTAFRASTDPVSVHRGA
jgi:hypothetical protein